MAKPTLKVDIKPENNPAQHPLPELSCNDGLWRVTFAAMASDCEILLEGVNKKSDVEEIIRPAIIETWRIENKYSRYRRDNIMFRINNSGGTEILIDSETNALLDFADQCYQLSDGLFDISSGVLRRVWHFDGSDNVPSQTQIKNILPLVGWSKVKRILKKESAILILPTGMELDLGGLGKEFAVDRSMFLLQQNLIQAKHKNDISFLINYGGDLACSGPRLNGMPWTIAVESIQSINKPSAHVRLTSGAVATSGDANRYLFKNGIRYSHVLNPKTGHSVSDAPHSISVSGTSCMQAGMLSTMASLHGADAEAFLEAQDVEYWIQR